MITLDYIIARIQRKKFITHDKQYPYFIHPYQWTQYNERAVEVPVFLDLLRQYRGRRILEVGNVLFHYIRADHTVVDKYEIGKNVINQDIIDFAPTVKYDLVISISTLEHIGFNENRFCPDKPLRAVEHLKSLLSPAGLLVISIPLGWTPAVDAYIDKGSFRFDEIICFKRSDDGAWTEKPYTSVKGSVYSMKPYPYQTANGLVIGYYTKGAP